MDDLEQKLEVLIENIRQLGIIVSDFKPQGQVILNQKINQVVNSLSEINRFKDQAQDVQIPAQVFDYIDEGRNPQLYTKDCMEAAVANNEQVKGKIDSYKRFRAMLLVELTKVFPNEVARYRAIRGDERPST